MEQLKGYLTQIIQTLHELPQQPLDRIAARLWAAYERDATIFVCGNGGSAATASHFACDLSKWTISPRARRVRAIALTDNIPLLTAWSNDQGYADVFVEQLRALYRPGDVVFAISGSGKSPNVLRAVQWANAEGGETIGISGFDGGQLARMAAVSLRVDNYSMPQVEDIHSTLCHALAVNLGKQIEQTLRPVAIPVAALLEHAVGGGGA